MYLLHEPYLLPNRHDTTIHQAILTIPFHHAFLTVIVLYKLPHFLMLLLATPYVLCFLLLIISMHLNPSGKDPHVLIIHFHLLPRYHQHFMHFLSSSSSLIQDFPVLLNDYRSLPHFLINLYHPYSCNKLNKYPSNYTEIFNKKITSFYK